MSQESQLVIVEFTGIFVPVETGIEISNDATRYFKVANISTLTMSEIYDSCFGSMASWGRTINAKPVKIVGQMVIKIAESYLPDYDQWVKDSASRREHARDICGNE